MVFTGFWGAILALFLNLFFTFVYSVPGWLLLAFWYFGYCEFKWGAIWLGLWIAGNIIFMFALGGFASWAQKVGNEKQPERPDINPYSPKNEDFLRK
ncbi:MAG: hypothetical protein Q4D21_02925 [Phascolarctobacterium sp.]|nr:hypothetical protein [Phascolarctobacterium sp.]